MSQVIIGFSKSRTRFPLIGWLIALFQKGRYSHVYIKLWNDPHKKWLIIDATAHGVVVGDNDEFINRNRPVKEFTIEISDEMSDRFLWWGLDYARTEYSQAEVTGNFLQMVLKLKKNPFSKGRKYTRCNELVALALIQILEYDIPEAILDDIDLVWLDEYLENKLKPKG